MSKTVHIGSEDELNSLLQSSILVVTEFYVPWSAPCQRIAPTYEQISAQLSRSENMTFAKIDTDQHKEIKKKYEVTFLPTFIIFKKQKTVYRIKGTEDFKKLEAAVRKLLVELDYVDPGPWIGICLPKGYNNVTDQVDVRGLDLLNSDSECGTARVLFDERRPSSLDMKKKGPADGEEAEKDWVESDTDEQLMLFLPFMSTLKVHTLHITSLLPENDYCTPMRPKTIQIYSNRAHVLGFEEAEDLPATQSIELSPRDWDEKTGTAKVELRFVKFQNVTSLVIFVVDGEGSGDRFMRVRIDRLRIVGETGEKRDGKIEKIGDEA